MRRAFACLLLAALTAATPPPPERVIAPDGKATLSVNGVESKSPAEPSTAYSVLRASREFGNQSRIEPCPARRLRFLERH